MSSPANEVLHGEMDYRVHKRNKSDVFDGFIKMSALLFHDYGSWTINNTNTNHGIHLKLLTSAETDGCEYIMYDTLFR